MLSGGEEGGEWRILSMMDFRFDTDGTGKILVEDMKYVMKNLPVSVTDEEVEAMIKEVDGDGDGEIDLEEFKKMIGLD